MEEERKAATDFCKQMKVSRVRFVGIPIAIRLLSFSPKRPLQKFGRAGGARIALAALDKTLAEFNSDSARVYLAGLSMGGNGAWYLAYHYPERFSALVVVCGWVTARRGGSGTEYPAVVPSVSLSDQYETIARRISRIPVWIFHGDVDKSVPVEESRLMAAALKAHGADVQYSELAGVGHIAWDIAYSLPDLPRWMFKQRRAAK